VIDLVVERFYSRLTPFRHRVGRHQNPTECMGKRAFQRRLWAVDGQWRRIPRMSDESIAARIERLVTEEEDLRRREKKDSPDADALERDRDRLRAVEVELDRCWDLLRQRRAREEFGLDPDDASARGADTVEHYEQ
jgi:hypothetical protein